MSAKEQWDQTVATLRQQRDELQVKLALGKAELQDEWSGLESKWETLESKLEAATAEASSAAGEVNAAARLLAEEISKGYQRVIDRLK